VTPASTSYATRRLQHEPAVPPQSVAPVNVPSRSKPARLRHYAPVLPLCIRLRTNDFPENCKPPLASALSLRLILPQAYTISPGVRGFSLPEAGPSSISRHALVIHYFWSRTFGRFASLLSHLLPLYALSSLCDSSPLPSQGESTQGFHC